MGSWGVPGWGGHGGDLADRSVVAGAGGRGDLDALHQPLQLLPHVPRPAQGARLYEVLVAPLQGVSAGHPLRGGRQGHGGTHEGTWGGHRSKDMAGHRGDRDTGGEDKDTLSTWSWTPTLCPDLPPRASLNPPSSPPAPQTAPPPPLRRLCIPQPAP